jgi:hypothetical protein
MRPLTALLKILTRRAGLFNLRSPDAEALNLHTRDRTGFSRMIRRGRSHLCCSFTLCYEPRSGKHLHLLATVPSLRRCTRGLDFTISLVSLHLRITRLPSFPIRGAFTGKLRQLEALIRLVNVCGLATLARTLFDMMD